MQRAAQPGEPAVGDVGTLLRARSDGDGSALARHDPREVLKVSPVTVMRDWSTAKAWLYRELTGGAGDGF
jgi:hypothetical protein